MDAFGLAGAKRRRWAAGAAAFVALTLAADGAEAAAPANPAERAAILNIARVPARQALHRPVRLLVRRLDVEENWAFLSAEMRATNGRRLTYTGTPLAGPRAHGMASDVYVALLKEVDGDWRVIVNAVGPTDMPQETWSRDYGAPAALFVESGGAHD